MVAIAVFVHWNKNDTLLRSDLFTINEIAKNVDHLIVVRNLNKSRNGLSEPPLSSNVQIIYRPNNGYDFGGYKAGIEFVFSNYASINELTLCNNSVFTITDALANTFDNCRLSNFDLTGLTDSVEVNWHLQSYFLHFKESILNSPVFIDWWNNAPISNKKSETVNSLEIPLGNAFIKAGFRVGALWDFEKIKVFATSGVGIALLGQNLSSLGLQELYSRICTKRDINPTHMLWIHLLELGFPFIKKDLVAGRVPHDLSQSKWRFYVNNDELREMIQSEI